MALSEVGDVVGFAVVVFCAVVYRDVCGGFNELCCMSHWGVHLLKVGIDWVW